MCVSVTVSIPKERISPLLLIVKYYGWAIVDYEVNLLLTKWPIWGIAVVICPKETVCFGLTLQKICGFFVEFLIFVKEYRELTLYIQMATVQMQCCNPARIHNKWYLKHFRCNTWFAFVICLDSYTHLLHQAIFNIEMVPKYSFLLFICLLLPILKVNEAQLQSAFSNRTQNNSGSHFEIRITWFQEFQNTVKSTFSFLFLTDALVEIVDGDGKPMDPLYYNPGSEIELTCIIRNRSHWSTKTIWLKDDQPLDLFHRATVR